MCLDTAVSLETEQEGLGYKCFNVRGEQQLLTMLHNFPVERGEWISNPRPNTDIGYRPRAVYRSGFHILKNRHEAYLYLAREWGFQNRPWRIQEVFTSPFAILPVKYKQAHTQGGQYGYEVVVADELYILTEEELREFQRDII